MWYSKVKLTSELKEITIKGMSKGWSKDGKYDQREIGLGGMQNLSTRIPNIPRRMIKISNGSVMKENKGSVAII